MSTCFPILDSVNAWLLTRQGGKSPRIRLWDNLEHITSHACKRLNRRCNAVAVQLFQSGRYRLQLRSTPEIPPSIHGPGTVVNDQLKSLGIVLPAASCGPSGPPFTVAVYSAPKARAR